MRRIQFYIIFSVVSLLITSCDSDSSCKADDWAGTWSGTIVDIDGFDEETSVTILAVGDDMISFSQDGTDYENITVTGCSFSESQFVSTGFGDLDISISATLSGDMMTLDVMANFLGEDFEQSTILTRQ